MPRPKRTKVVPSAPAPRIRKPAKGASARSANAEAREPSFDSLYDASDLENNISKMQSVNKGKGRELLTGAGRQEESDIAIVVTEGKLDAATQELPKHTVMDPTDDSSLSLGNLDASSSDVEVGRRGRETPGMDSSLISIGNFRRRPRQPSILGCTGRGRSSSIDSDITEGTGITSAGPKNTSSLAIGAFKRRPRQPSIMGRGPASARPSCAGLELYSSTPTISRGTHDIGTAERGRRRGSNGAVGSKRLRPDYDTEDDFNPEDESTPLNISKTMPVATSPNSRKRKLSDVQVPQSSPLSSPKLSSLLEAPPQNSSLAASEADEAISPTQQLSRRESRAVTPDIMSDTMAPPLSISSQDNSPVIARALQQLRSRTRSQLRATTPTRHFEESPPSSPPSLTHSPNLPTLRRPRPRTKTPPPPPSRLPTAQLQSFLPRRRHRDFRDPFDIASSDDENDTSSLASDEDELTHMPIYASNRNQRNVSRAPVMKRTASKAKSRAKLKPQPVLEKTYGVRGNHTSDKENEGADFNDSLMPSRDDQFEETENSQELEERVGKELKRATRKFAEVDKWELDFEEITASSSPQNGGR